MFKSKNNLTIQKPFLKKTKKSDFLVYFSLIILACGTNIALGFKSNAFSLSPTKKLTQQLDLMQEKAINQLQTQYLTSQQITTNLFEKNLKAQDSQFEVSASLALKQTADIIKKNYSCSLSQEEIASFLYINDPTFKHYIKKANLNDKSSNNNTDNVLRRDNIAKACLKLSKCISPQNLNTLSISTCTQIVLDAYLPIQKAAQDQQQIQIANLGSNKYLNGENGDSDYDLLYDVEQIGKVFFNGNQSFKSAPKTLLYQAPNLNTQTFGQNKNQKADSTLDQLSGNNLSTTALSGRNIGLSTTAPSGIQNQNILNTTEDPEINSFLNSTTQNSAKNQNDELIFINQCLPPGYEKAPSHIKANIENTLIQNSAINTTSNLSASQDLNNQLNTLKKINTPPINTFGINNNGNIRNINTNFPEKDEKVIEQCMRKCEAKDESGKYQLAFDERQICKLQCLCDERSSPALPNEEIPILEPAALRIRFCTVPAKAMAIDTSSKKVYSIAEIISEIQAPITNINIGGRTTTQQKKSEFLDSHYINRDLSKTAGININFGQKSDPTITSIKDKMSENKAILGISQKEYDKNAFRMVDTNGKNTISKTSTTPAPNMTPNPINPEINLERLKQADTNLQLNEFLVINYNFLASFTQNLKMINDSLTTLYNKK